MTDFVDLNSNRALGEPSWNYHMKTYANACGRHSHRQVKFQHMENELMKMETLRMRMFFAEATRKKKQEYQMNQKKR